MIKTIKNLILSLVLATGSLVAPVALVSSVHAASTANIDQSLCAGANLSANEGDSCDNTDAAVETANELMVTVINIFSLVVGVTSVIMIIIGGLKYITSGGDSGNVSGAKNTILYAIIGLVVVALAQVIVRFVLAKVSST